MMPKIGIKVIDLAYDGIGKVDSKNIEIKADDSLIGFRKKDLDAVKEKIKGKEVSMHSQIKRAFSYKELFDIEMTTAKLEILLCKYLKIKELIFHLKQDILSRKEKGLLRELLRFAKKNNVEIIYESNGKFKAKTTLDVLKSFPKLNYNLDIGHLNSAICNKTLGMSMEKFIGLVKSSIVYLHLHNNNGEDEHKSLENGSLDWRKVLDMLDFKNIKKIILETKDYSKMKEDEKLVKDYLKERMR